MKRSAAPIATYRLQFNGRFTLRAAARLVPYLKELGVSHVYASPLLRARGSSTHGYDVVDPARIDPRLGGDAALSTLSSALRRHDMELLLDIVPNHMATGCENAWWLDVLEHGPGSPFAAFFDIDWEADRDSRAPRQVLLPILGDPFGAVLERGELRLRLRDGALWTQYYEHLLPVSIWSYPLVIDLAGGAPRRFAARIRAGSQAARTATRHEAARKLKAAFRQLCRRSEQVRRQLAAALRRVNGKAGAPDTFSRLERLHDQQHYRLAWWRSAPHLINYRRFFDINDLVGVRVEKDDVFEATHRLPLTLFHRGMIAGFRIDHIDGLRDPRRYLSELRRRSLLGAGHGRPRRIEAAGAPGVPPTSWSRRSCPRTSRCRAAGEPPERPDTTF